ncbi:MAG: hypothetical protein ACI9J3_002228 [Parvicellaceae bacterium]|jgi:hypothetical protein
MQSYLALLFILTFSFLSFEMYGQDQFYAYSVADTIYVDIEPTGKPHNLHEYYKASYGITLHCELPTGDTLFINRIMAHRANTVCGSQHTKVLGGTDLYIPITTRLHNQSFTKLSFVIETDRGNVNFIALPNYIER